MTKHENNGKKPADFDEVLRDAKKTYGLVKKAAVKGGKMKTQDKVELVGAVAKTAMDVVGLAVDQHKKYKAKKEEKDRASADYEDERERKARHHRSEQPHYRR